MKYYVERKKAEALPRIPLEGSIDLTYRCNNNCLHCWLQIPENSPGRDNELSFDEIRWIVDDARKMGCRRWSISGGEPMLRPDFADIFEYITGKSVSNSLNTNGTLITPEIAKLMKKKGSKMIALYGASAEVHDHITRSPGSFEAAIKGMVYLKEAEAGFTAQLMLMRDNYHQFKDMICLAESLTPLWRVGAAWLYPSAYGNPEKNREIKRQRLSPKQVVELDGPDLSYEAWMKKEESHNYCHLKDGDRLFASCINKKHDFHVDPYGQMSFCCFIKNPTLRYDLKKGTFKQVWEELIPSLKNRVRGGKEYLENCGSCELRSDCRWCPVYGYLEHRRFSAKVEYLCSVAKENRKFKENWRKNRRRYFQIAGITIRIDSDLPINDSTFHPKFKLFEVDGPGEDNISIRHHFSLPKVNGRNLGSEVFRKPPWAIYRKGNSWIYLGILPASGNKYLHKVAVFNHNHTRAKIYNDKEETYRKGNLHSLTLFPTDQILIARLLADREGCYLHSAGAIFEKKGFLFVGHSDAGKSTLIKMLKGKADILCDDRMIVRKHMNGFKIHGTWSHGEVAQVSSDSAPLRAILFLKKSEKNKILPLDNKQEVIKKLLACLIKPLATADWWKKMLKIVERVASKVPCYSFQFDKSGRILDRLKRL